MSEDMIIAVDFDGTLCKNCWPDIGEPNYELIDYLMGCRYQGVKLILWTCREGELLDKAVAWCEERGLFFDAVNDNIPETIKEYGNNCRKVSADIYIDDRSVNPFPMRSILFGQVSK